LPAHLDLLCQTSPTPAIEPDIALYLHGINRGAPEARVVWRADLDPSRSGDWPELVGLCRPLSGEALSVPLWRLRAWLRAEASGAVADGADIEGVDTSDEDGSGAIRPALLWRGRDRSHVVRRDSDVGPNDVVIVPAAYGIEGLGQPSTGFDKGLGEKGLDLWEACLSETDRPLAVRLSPDMLGAWTESSAVADLLAVVRDDEVEETTLREAVEDFLARLSEPDAEKVPPQWWKDIVRPIGAHAPVERLPGGGVILRSRSKDENKQAESDLFADDDDTLSVSGEETPLESHLQAVAYAVERIAKRCLPATLQPVLRDSALWHDAGKADERFQLLLRNGDGAAVAAGQPLAKSAFVPLSPERRTAIRKLAELPDAFRHEMLSMQLAEAWLGDKRGTPDGDLLLHLVASHHGRSRPFAPVSSDPNPAPVSFRLGEAAFELTAEERKGLVPAHRADSGVSERFWRLTRQYGWWGLAYLEAMLRLGDWYASEHGIGPAPGAASAVLSGSSGAGASPSDVDGGIPLTGLDGANPLGYLAALGVATTLGGAGFERVRLRWARSATWVPVLSGVGNMSPESLSATLAEALQGATVSAEAERTRDELESVHLTVRRKLKKQTEAIKARGLRGKERDAAWEAEVTPLEAQVGQARKAWLAALKQASPSPELALGKQINCSPEEYREDHAPALLEDALPHHREAVDLLAAFASDACADKGRVFATPFCFITGSGHQYFLDTVRELMGKADPALVERALFQPWTYDEEKLSMRWDPVEDRRYALMDRDPTASDNKSRTVWMANLLAYRALALFPSAPSHGHLATTGWTWTRKAPKLTWPIWTQPLDRDSIRSLLLDDAIQQADSDQDAARERRARGVAAAFRADRIQVGNPPLHKVNFSLSREI
ncbi:MAG: CRISPR-associated endonuclease Cas3'', partial [Acidobacteria bacterium]|nr:CRISPR-associated endonuclease Cas3'' [Acidobacteriota bacterium]